MDKIEKKLAQLAEFSQHFFSVNYDSDRQNPLDPILDFCIHVTGSERGTLFLDPQYETHQDVKYLRSYISKGLNQGKIKLDTTNGVAGHVFRSQKSYWTNEAASDTYFYSKIDEETGYKTKSLLAVPLFWKNSQIIGVLQVLNKKTGPFDETDCSILETISVMISLSIENYEILRKSADTEKIQQHQKNKWRKSIASVSLLSDNDELQKIYRHIPEFAKSDSNVLITGESGTGKEVIARLTHHHSDRSDGPFVAINCAAIPESLFEAELFGVTKGAATGTTARQGQVELAHKGTLFLDEIGEMPVDMQAKLLRVLQERKVQRLGSNEKPQEIDFRLICATNKSLEKLIVEEKFREDLYYRINVVHFHLPPLRSRIEDIEKLAESIVLQLHHKRGWKLKQLTPEAIEKLKQHSWPGNIRELENKIESAYLQAQKSESITAEHIHFFNLNKVTTPVGENTQSQNGAKIINLNEFSELSLKEAREKFEHHLIESHLISQAQNKSAVARKLGLSREGLRKILKKSAA